MQRKSAKGQRKKQKARIKKNPDNIETADEKSSVVCFLFATKTTTCYAGGKGKALARKEVTK